MAVPSVIGDLSQTAGSNSPAGTDNIGTNHDNFLRAHASFIAILRDRGSVDNYTLTDTLLTVQDNSDNTKKFNFNAGLISTSTTRTYSMPDGNTTLLGNNLGQSITGSGQIDVGTTDTDVSTNTSGGAEGVNLTTTGRGYFCSEGIPVIINRITNTGEVCRISSNGTGIGGISTDGSTVSFNQSSDYRLKENIQPIEGALSRITGLKPCTYDWKAGGSGRGFIAHELHQQIPAAVTGEKDAVDEEGFPVYQQVDLSKIVPDLVAAVQELAARVQELEGA